MPDADETIFLRDASLEEEVRAIATAIVSHPDRVVVDPLTDPGDPEYNLQVYLFPTSVEQRDEWIRRLREQLAAELGVTDAPSSEDLDELEAAELRAQAQRAASRTP